MADKPTRVRLDVPDDGVEQLHEKTPAHGVVTVPLMQRKLTEVREESFAAALKGRFVTLLLSGGISAAGLGGVAYAYDHLNTNAKDAGIEGANLAIAPVVEKAKGTEARTTVLEQQRAADRAEFDARFVRLEHQGDRQETKMDALLQRLDVPNPAPAPPPTKDGGR